MTNSEQMVRSSFTKKTGSSNYLYIYELQYQIYGDIKVTMLKVTLAFTIIDLVTPCSKANALHLRQ